MGRWEDLFRETVPGPVQGNKYFSKELEKVRKILKSTPVQMIWRIKPEQSDWQSEDIIKIVRRLLFWAGILYLHDIAIGL